MLVEYTCRRCGAAFSTKPRRPLPRYCSLQCYWANQVKSPEQRHWYTCQRCGVRFTAKVSDRSRYCSWRCYRAGPAKPVEERFWSKVDKTPECWIWTGATNSRGYGLTTNKPIPGVGCFAHRLSWFLAYGPIPDDLCVLHRCDNRECVRPDHLWLGTRADNLRDMVEKGRQSRGVSQPHAKLTVAKVVEIRRLAAQGASHTRLAGVFGVSRSSVDNVVNGTRWGWVPAQ
jgi:hypothetical protein